MNFINRNGWISAVILLLSALPLAAQQRNGFDLSNALIPAEEIFPGGPPRDGIPAIDDPQFVSAEEAGFLKAGDRVLGIYRRGIARAYPINILNWHEIVNDRFGEEAIAVTYCPLCGSGVAFSAIIRGKETSFGVSGLLYNNDVLLYDRRSESLWSQLMGQAVSGPLKGETLTVIPISHTTWEDWRQEHPNTLVLSTDTGYRRDYSRNPYRGYENHEQIMFPVSHSSDRHHGKEMVLGVEIAGTFKAYPFSELEKTDGSVRETLNGREIVIHFNEEHHSARVTGARAEEIPATILYWFAWVAFHPQTQVFRAK